MKLLLKQYLASLNERDELDVVLPDIMSEVGYTVISRPKRGTTQYGVDVAATGAHPETGEKALFLLSIKSGDLTRDEWATGQQALRPSLEEILEVYIPKHVPKRYRGLPIIIALCFGGDIQEDVRPRIDGFIDKNTVAGKIEFAEWNGDYIADLIATGLLRENIFSKPMRSSFRKAVALVDEPAVCVSHFADLVVRLTKAEPKKPIDRLRIARQIYIASWTIFVWCRDADNLEAAYRASALATLKMWDLCRAHFGPRKTGRAIAEAMDKMFALFRIIGAAFIEQHVAPYAKTDDGLGVSVPSSASVDVNLKLFEVLGRVALQGLWLIHAKAFLGDDVEPEHKAALDQEIDRTRQLITDMIDHNPVYYSPLRDDHAIEISLVGFFMLHCRAHNHLSHWIDQITMSCIFAHRSDGAYPCVFQEYADLAQHPKHTEDYQEEATIGSVLYPTLGMWLAVFRNEPGFDALAKFHAQDMAHSTWQMWIPDTTSEEHYYANSANHGSAVTHLDTANGLEGLVSQVEKEVLACAEFAELSAMQYGCWPIIFMTSQHYRLPVPPHFWTMRLIPEAEREPEKPEENEGGASPD